MTKITKKWKLSNKNFENFQFLAILSLNGYVPEKKNSTGIFFELNFFGLKYVLKHYESIPKKIFFRKCFSIIFFFCPFSSKKWLSPRKNFSTGNFFRNQLFRFKIRLKHSESIWKKKSIFFSNRFRMFQNVFWTEKVDFEKKILLNIFFWDLTIFWRKWPKGEKFRKKFEKKIVVGIDSECFKTYFKPK